jgi:hypothetical protein
MRPLDGVVIFLLVLSMQAAAEPVFVQSQEDGQGFLRQRGSDCYLITPQHVLGPERSAELVGERAERYQGILERSYDPDLAILRVPDRSDCPSRFPDGGALRELLRNTSSARLLTRSASGAVRQTGVEIIASDERFIRIRARSGERLFRGMSGSPLMIGRSTAGMLQSVDADSGSGTVLRQDYMSRVLESWFPQVYEPSRPHITNRVRPTVSTNDADGLISHPNSDMTQTRAVIDGGVRPARPLPEEDDNNN